MKQVINLCRIVASMSFLFAVTAFGASANKALEQSGFTGGLVVHLGCGDGKQTVELRANDSLLVHGLERDTPKVAEARANVMKAGLYGPVSIDRLVGKTLPYADNMVNLVVADDPQGITMDEIKRVLAPNGMALVKGNEYVKPWPKSMDEWTHFLHSPDGNAVGKDKLVGPPRHLRWMGNPKYSRGHEQQASFSSAVTANGRMFYIADLAPTVDIRMPAKWTLVARDAFNGVVLWKRELGEWIDHLRRFRAGPASTQFRIVAAKEHLFVTLDFEGPVHVIDAKTGKTHHVIEGSEYTKQILHRPDDNALLLLTDKQVGKFKEIDRARLTSKFIKHECAILKVDTKSGKTLWTHKVDDLVFPCIAYRSGRVFGQTTKSVFAVLDDSGKELWKKDLPITLGVAGGKAKSGELQWESPSILVGEKAVYAADFKKIKAYAIENGYELWSGASSKGYNAPPDMHMMEGLLWMNGKGGRVALDPITGETKKTLPTHRGYMHARCYRNKATEQYLMMGLMGVQMLDIKTGEIWDNDWIRGTCQYGILPANGLIYVPPDSCACNMKTKLSGIYALAGENAQTQIKSETPALEKGPAFGKFGGSANKDGDWPMFRAAGRRNGLNAAKVPSELKKAWSVDIGGRLSAISAADGRAFVAAIDQHTVYALNQKDGKTIWQFTAGARVDSPPTIHNGAAYFGSADGYVYAVRVVDGELIWRFRAAPEDRRVFVQGQLESAWPVHGAVLVHDGALAFTAGRSSYLDGGVSLFRLDPATGKEISKVVIYSPDEKGKQATGGGKDVFGVLNDVLLADGKNVFMRHCKLDYEKGAMTETGAHLFSPIGFLDDTWWHRSYWLFHTEFTSHWSGWWRQGNRVPSGRIMSYDAKNIFGFGRDKYPGGNTGQYRGGEINHLYALDRSAPVAKPVVQKPAPKPQPKKQDPKKKTRRKRKPQTPVAPLKYTWSTAVPLLGTSLAVTADHVFVAGPPDLAESAGRTTEALLKLKNPQDAVDAWHGRKGGMLYVASRSDGKKVATYDLPSSTVFDGMAAVDGHVLLSLKNGQVVCMSAK